MAWAWDGAVLTLVLEDEGEYCLDGWELEKEGESLEGLLWGSCDDRSGQEEDCEVSSVSTATLTLLGCHDCRQSNSGSDRVQRSSERHKCKGHCSY